MARRPLTLRTYRMLTAVGAPLAYLLLLQRRRRGKEHATRIGERRGKTAVPRPDGPLVWLHGASVGEMLSVLSLIERIRARGIAVLVTTGTVTAAELAERRLPPGAIHQFVPIDTPQSVGRFLNHWRPDLALFVESDLWPNLIMAGAARKIPMILINARLSAHSFNRWRLLPRTIGTLLGAFDLCLAQSTEDATRYADLGAQRYVTTGNLKFDLPAPPADNSKLWQLKAAVGARPVFAAASTHPGEEVQLIEVHRWLKRNFPRLLTILAPRHPDRGPDIAGMAQAVGLSFTVRSRGELPNADTDIYVADTLGELGLIYRVAPIVFMGGSLVEHGGQNAIEAAKLGAAILHGPHVWNFAEVYSTLDAAGGAVMAPDAPKLAGWVDLWLKNADARTKVASAGRDAMNTLTGALERTVAALDPYLVQLSLEARGNDA